MSIPTSVILLHAVLGISFVAFVAGLSSKSFRPFVIWGALFNVSYLLSYLIHGIPHSIATFTAVYDPLYNLGIENDPSGSHNALKPCENNNNTCTIWDYYQNHPTWAVDFYGRYTGLQQSQRKDLLLYGHIFFNTVAFVLMNTQFLTNKKGGRLKYHKYVGRIAFAAMVAGSICALLLTEVVPSYGGIAGVMGWYWMVGWMVGCAAVGIFKAHYSKDFVAHRRWMIRANGAIWGAFWLFRVLFFVCGPIFRDAESVTSLLSIWLSVPGGILIAEAIFRNTEGRHSSHGSSHGVHEKVN